MQWAGVTQASTLLSKVELEEQRLLAKQPNKKLFHLSIINLVIGYLSTTSALARRPRDRP